jgi:hypothetical protein
LLSSCTFIGDGRTPHPMTARSRSCSPAHAAELVPGNGGTEQFIR